MNLCFLHPHPGRWVFGFHKFCSHLLSSFLLHPPPRTFSHLSSYILCHTSRGLPSCILRQTYSLWHTLLHIFYHIFSLTYSVRHLLSDILYLASSVRISHLHFAFSFRICILHLHLASNHTRFTLYLALSNLPFAYRIMSHSNPAQLASTAMQSPRSRLLELPNEVSI